MRRLLMLAAAVTLSACNPLSRDGPSAAELRAPCDRLAAQAIDTDDLDEARRLAARASECYAGLRSR